MNEMNENEKMDNDNPLAERTQKCPKCGSNVITDYTRAEIYCSACGTIIEENLIDLGPEWRAFDLNRVRTGPPSTYTIHDKGLGSKTNSRSLKNEEKRAISLLAEIYRICSILKLNNDFREQASYLSRKIVKAEFGKYQNRLSIATAIIYG